MTTATVIKHCENNIKEMNYSNKETGNSRRAIKRRKHHENKESEEKEIQMKDSNEVAPRYDRGQYHIMAGGVP
jgi:hypothetical protein